MGAYLADTGSEPPNKCTLDFDEPPVRDTCMCCCDVLHYSGGPSGPYEGFTSGLKGG